MDLVCGEESTLGRACVLGGGGGLGMGRRGGGVGVSVKEKGHLPFVLLSPADSKADKKL